MANKTDMPITPTFFATPVEFRDWLVEHHQSVRELWVGFHKKDSGKPSITWPELVDEALCFGWIDGLRKSRRRRQLYDPLHAAQAAAARGVLSTSTEWPS